jgi:hypothetical protein
MTPLGLIAGILLLVAALLGIVFVPLRRLAAQRTQAIRERFPNAKLIVPGANFYGQESRGVMQMRGNGTLVLTDSELYFEGWLPRREFRIPLGAIQTIETPTSYLGKTNFRPLVKVVFRDAAGQTDSMAWLVPDVGGLKHALEEARQAR